MPKINSVRFININYGDKSKGDTKRHICDETLDFGGDTSLLLLENGGGKTVMMQLLLAPFVSDKKHDNRDFADYFTTEPSFILVEWLLDDNAGYLLNGLMVRRGVGEKADGEGEEAVEAGFGGKDLDIMAFAWKYATKNYVHDIGKLSFIGNGVGTDDFTLRTYSDYANSMKGVVRDDRDARDPHDALCYDVSKGGEGWRKYIALLNSYGIEKSHWESVIKVVNDREGAIDGFFKKMNASNPGMMVESLMRENIIPAIERKKGEESVDVRKLADNVATVVKMNLENKADVDEKPVLEFFTNSMNDVRDVAVDWSIARQEGLAAESSILGLKAYMVKELSAYTDEAAQNEDKIAAAQQDFSALKHREYSKRIYDTSDEMAVADGEARDLAGQVTELMTKISNCNHNIRLLEGAKLRDEKSAKEKRLEAVTQRLTAAKNKRQCVRQAKSASDGQKKDIRWPRKSTSLAHA